MYFAAESNLSIDVGIAFLWQTFVTPLERENRTLTRILRPVRTWIENRRPLWRDWRLLGLEVVRSDWGLKKGKGLHRKPPRGESAFQDSLKQTAVVVKPMSSSKRRKYSAYNHKRATAAKCRESHHCRTTLAIGERRGGGALMIVRTVFMSFGAQLIRHHALKTYRGRWEIAPPFLT
jgi:hypothetical protein